MYKESYTYVMTVNLNNVVPDNIDTNVVLVESKA